MEAPEELRGLARKGLSRIAASELKARRPRIDAVFYLLDALRLFLGKSLHEIHEITLEIGMLGKYGLNVNDPQESHVLRVPPRRAFSALQLICITYTGFKRIELGMDIRVDQSDELVMAEKLGGKSGREASYLSKWGLVGSPPNRWLVRGPCGRAPR